MCVSTVTYETNEIARWLEAVRILYFLQIIIVASYIALTGPSRSDADGDGVIQAHTHTACAAKYVAQSRLINHNNQLPALTGTHLPLGGEKQL